MLSLKTIMGIIRTEAVELGGIKCIRCGAGMRVASRDGMCYGCWVVSQGEPLTHEDHRDQGFRAALAWVLESQDGGKKPRMDDEHEDGCDCWLCAPGPQVLSSQDVKE